MWRARSLVCALAMVLATAVFAEGEEGAVDEGSSQVEGMLSSQLLDKIRGYLRHGVLESEQLASYVDSDYWDTIKDEFSSRISTVISEDEFIQAILPVIDNVHSELRELIALTLQELTKRSENIATRVRAALERLKHRVVEIIKGALSRVQELSETKPEEYRALIAKAGSAVGQEAITIAQETTLVVGLVLHQVAGSQGW